VVDGAAEHEHERIEIGRRDEGRVRIDVEPDEGKQ
jgi:hypothetical protein